MSPLDVPSRRQTVNARNRISLSGSAVKVDSFKSLSETDPLPAVLELEATEGLVLAKAEECLFDQAIEVVPVLRRDPFLADLKDLVNRIRRSEPYLSITTHGLALAVERYHELAPVLGHLEVLFDSPDRRLWAMAGRGRHYDRVLANLRAIAPLAERDGIRLGLDIVVADADPDAMCRSVRLAAWTGVGTLTLLTSVDVCDEARLDAYGVAAEEADRLGVVLCDASGVPCAHPDYVARFPRDRIIALLEALARFGRPSLDREALTVHVSDRGEVTTDYGRRRLGNLIVDDVSTAVRERFDVPV